MEGAGGPQATFAPTHVVNTTGYSWTAPDASLPSSGTVYAGTDVRVLEVLGAWARSEFSNGWVGWVDARTLTPLQTQAPQYPAPQMPGVQQQPVAQSARVFHGTLIATIGAAVALVGSLLPWFSSGGLSVNAWNIPLVGLITRDQTLSALKTGYVFLIPLLVGLPLITRRPMNRWVRVALGIIPIDTAALAWRLGGRGVGIGIFASIVGGFMIAYASFFQRAFTKKAPR